MTEQRTKRQTKAPKKFEEGGALLQPCPQPARQQGSMSRCMSRCMRLDAALATAAAACGAMQCPACTQLALPLQHRAAPPHRTLACLHLPPLWFLPLKMTCTHAPAEFVRLDELDADERRKAGKRQVWKAGWRAGCCLATI